MIGSKSTVLSSLLAIGVVLGATAPLQAGDVICDGYLEGAQDDVFVPEGAVCSLSGLVEGDVNVEGALNVFPPAFIEGKIKGNKEHRYVRLLGTDVVVAEDVHIKEQRGSEPGGFLAGTVIQGDFKWEKNEGFLMASEGVVWGDFEVKKNAGGGNIAANAIGGDLKCDDNEPAFTGFGNLVEGEIDEECGDLE